MKDVRDREEDREREANGDDRKGKLIPTISASQLTNSAVQHLLSPHPQPMTSLILPSRLFSTAWSSRRSCGCVVGEVMVRKDCLRRQTSTFPILKSYSLIRAVALTQILSGSIDRYSTSSLCENSPIFGGTVRGGTRLFAAKQTFLYSAIRTKRRRYIRSIDRTVLRFSISSKA